MFGIPMMAASFVLNLNGMVGKIILSGAGLYADVGVFAIATTLANVFSIIPTAFATFWSPYMYRHYEDDHGTILRMHNLVMWGVAAIVAAIVVFQDWLFLLVGGDYAECQIYFMLIMTNPIQALICETTAYGIAIKEKPIYNVTSSVLGVAVSVAVTYGLMGLLGPLAAALGVAASSALICIMRSIVGQRYYKSVPCPARSFTVGFLVLLVCGLNGFLCGSIVLEIVVGAALFLAATVVYKGDLKVLLKSATAGKHRKGCDRG